MNTGAEIVTRVSGEGMTHGLSAYANTRCRCEVCVAAWNAYARERRAQRTLAGLCQDCSEPPELGKTRCRRHLDAALARQFRHQLRKAQQPIAVSPLVVYCLRRMAERGAAR